MSELVGRFLSFEEHLGRDLVKFVYYVLLFLLVVTTLYDMVLAVIGIFSGEILAGLGKFFVAIPVRFFISLLLLRVGSEVVIAVLSIDDNLRAGGVSDDTMSSGLNPVPRPADVNGATPPSAEATEERGAEDDHLADDDEDDAPANDRSDGETKPKD